MRAAIGLGSSLGPRRRHLETAVRRLTVQPAITGIRCSRWYRTPPMRGGTARNWFLNGVLLVETTLSPMELLHVCQREETRAGRRRGNHWGDRTLDLDLLVYEDVQIRSTDLDLPHPGMHIRDFVRRPLLEVWPEVLHASAGTRLADAPAAARPHAWSVGLPSRSVFSRASRSLG